MAKFMQKAVPLSSRISSKLTLPEKFKGGRIERIHNYFRNLYTDYSESSLEVLKNCQNRPFKASMYSAIGLTLLYLNQNRPNEQHFQDQFVRFNHDLGQISDLNRNKISQNHCQRVQKNQNQGTLRFTNLGIATLVWEDDFDSSVGNFRSQCSYMQPTYKEIISTRIVDFGINGKWRQFEKVMKDYDINFDEWDSNGNPTNPESQLKPMI